MEQSEVYRSHQWQRLNTGTARTSLLWCNGCGALKQIDPDQETASYCQVGGHWSERIGPCNESAPPSGTRRSSGTRR